MRYLLSFLCFLPCVLLSQLYTSYHTGNHVDFSVTPLGGLCLMGGASEDDQAMKMSWQDGTKPLLKLEQLSSLTAME